MSQVLTQDEEEREYRKYMTYARITGSIPLVDIFKIKAPKKTTNNRFINLNIKATEIIWGTALGAIVLIIQFTIRSFITPTNIITRMFWGWEGMLFFFIAFFAIGVLLSRRSPYRKYSGEEATSYFKVNAIMLFNKAFVKIGMIPAVYKPIITTMTDRTSYTEQIAYGKVYIGICPADYVTKVANPYDLNEPHRIRAVSEKKTKEREKSNK